MYKPIKIQEYTSSIIQNRYGNPNPIGSNDVHSYASNSPSPVNQSANNHARSPNVTNVSRREENKILDTESQLSTQDLNSKNNSKARRLNIDFSKTNIEQQLYDKMEEPTIIKDFYSAAVRFPDNDRPKVR